MSFNVNWNTLETDALRSWTVDLLTNALNLGKRPNILASDIVIKDLNFGKVAPNFEILEIGELGKDRFRGIFKITYLGDFHLTLHTKVQANPLKIYSDNSLEREVSNSPFVTPDFLLSVDPFNLPMDLKLSDIKISGIGIIVFSKTKGLTLVFRNDPLDSIKVSSTFDTVQVLANFLQKQIEHQIRDLFRETLPTLLHKVSLKYTASMDNGDIIDNLKDHLVAEPHFNVLDTLELEHISPRNLSKLVKLYDSRETLTFNVPRFRKVVQRNHLEKFNKSMYPNLAKSLYSSLNLNLPMDGAVTPNSNSIPVDLFVQNDYSKVDEILVEIADIQTRSYAATNDRKTAHRRKIRLGRRSKKTAEDTEPLAQFAAANMSVSNTIYRDALSDTSTMMAEEGSTHIEQPTPKKAEKMVRPLINAHIQSSKFAGCPSPLSSNSSFVGGVGLGNSFFNIANARTVSASPLRREPVKAAADQRKVKVKRSINRIDIKQINQKLQTHKSGGEKTRPEARGRYDKKGAEPVHMYELPPPPYHQLLRV